MKTMTPGRLWTLILAVGATVALVLVYALEGSSNRGLVPVAVISLIRITVVITWTGYLAATFSDRILARIDQTRTELLTAVNVATRDQCGDNLHDRDAAAATEAHLEALRVLKEHRWGPQLVR